MRDISLDIEALKRLLSGWIETQVAVKASMLIEQERERILMAVRALNPEAAAAVEQALAANLTLSRIEKPSAPTT